MQNFTFYNPTRILFGSGRIADLMASKRPPISPDGLDIFRYGHSKENTRHVHPAPAH